MKVRINTFKSFRHYGGREITTITHVVDATFLFEQDNGTSVVSLNKASAGFPKGHKITIPNNNILEK